MCAKPWFCVLVGAGMEEVLPAAGRPSCLEVAAHRPPCKVRSKPILLFMHGDVRHESRSWVSALRRRSRSRIYVLWAACMLSPIVIPHSARSALLQSTRKPSRLNKNNKFPS